MLHLGVESCAEPYITQNLLTHARYTTYCCDLTWERRKLDSNWCGPSIEITLAALCAQCLITTRGGSPMEAPLEYRHAPNAIDVSVVLAVTVTTNQEALVPDAVG